MAKNTGDNTRKGAVKGEDQVLNTKTGKFTDVKSDGTPFKGVTKK